jgi:hypothetical protein
VTRFQKKKYLSRIKWTIAALFALGFIALMFIPPAMGDNYIKASKEKVALNFAATVAQAADTYYKKTNSIDFIGKKYGFEGEKIIFDKDNQFKTPIGYNCTILDSSVVVTHKDGSKGEVRWR